MGLVARETKYEQRVGTFRTIPWFLERVEELEVESITNTQLFIKPPHRPKTIGFGEMLDYEHMKICKERYTQKRHGNFNPFPHICPMHLFHLDIPEIYPFIMNWKSSE